MWLFIATISYLLNAGVYVADKFLLSKKIHSSVAYAFFVGIWSIFNFVLLPLDPWVPNFQEFILDILAGMLFLVTLIFWYKALHQSEATRVVPIVGALIPIFSLILSYVFLDAVLGERQLLAFFILINGGVLISVKYTKFYQFKKIANNFKNIFGNFLGGVHAFYRPTQRLILNSVISSFLFASYYVLIKYIYMTQPFIGGFVWSRLGSFIGVILMLAVVPWRKLIMKQKKENNSPKNFSFFIAVRLLAALAFIMLNWAISKGNVALINALQGLQYVFLILLVLFLSRRYPRLIKEEMGGGIMMQKVIGISLITIGLYMLVTYV